MYSILLYGIFVLVIAWVAVKFGINTTSVVLEMGINFTRRSRVKFTISNTTRVVFIPNFTATHAIPILAAYAALALLRTQFVTMY